MHLNTRCIPQNTLKAETRIYGSQRALGKLEVQVRQKTSRNSTTAYTCKPPHEEQPPRKSRIGGRSNLMGRTRGAAAQRYRA